MFWLAEVSLEMQTEPSPKNPTFLMSPLVNMELTHAYQAPILHAVQNEITDAGNSPKTEEKVEENTADSDAFGLPSWKTLHVASSAPSDSGEQLPDEDAGDDELDADGSVDSEFFGKQKGPQIHKATRPVNSRHNSSSGLFTEHEVSAAPSTPPRNVASVSRVSRSPSKFIGVVIPRSANSTPDRRMSTYPPSKITTLVLKTVRNDASDTTAVRQGIDEPILSSSRSKTTDASVKIPPPHTLIQTSSGPLPIRTPLEKPIVDHDESLVGALTAAFTKNAETINTFGTTVNNVPPLSNEKPRKSVLAPVRERPVRLYTKVQRRVYFDLDDIEEWLETDYATVQDSGTIPSSKELLEVTLETLRQVHTSPDAPERTQKWLEHDPKSLTEHYLLRVGDWFGQEALKNTRPMGHKYPKAPTKSAQRSREMSMEVDTPNEDTETNVGTYLGKRKRLDNDTDKWTPFGTSALFNDKQGSRDTDTDTLQNNRIRTMEKTGFSDWSVSLIQKFVKGKRAMEPKELQELHTCLSDIKQTGEHVNWSGNLGKVMWESLKWLSSMEDAPKKLRSSALEICQYWEARMGP
ncbi:hypothetical protein EDD18DRAFT_1351028 [Armillaria luteobubalina]|uniref:Uncharacterized protein n=1 Tax=Armillaria luteobubalina TaxID=153913 RepID=A0AA39UPY2_9AGAR|nr:hypothetical protein EDD18DRAFT_1351028 [Armillaria luteobubalina]